MLTLALLAWGVMTAGEATLTVYYCEDMVRIERREERAELRTRCLVELEAGEEMVTITVRGDQPVGLAARTYVVQAGDTLTRIAEHELGNRERWRDIAALNPALDIRQPLRVGQRLAMPGSQEGEAASTLVLLPGRAAAQYPVPVLRFVVTRDEGRRELRADAGMQAALVRELNGLLAQGPAVNVLRSQARMPYTVALLQGGQERALSARQVNGKLWADLTIGGSGEAEIGGREWQLPMRFEIPAQPAHGLVELAGSAELLYASIRPGAEGEVAARVSLALPWGRIERQFLAQPVLRQLPPAPAAGGANGTSPLAGSGVWTRAALLGLLGVHRLPGISEAGTLLWSVAVASEQAAAESDIGKALAVEWPEPPGIPLPGQVPRSEYEEALREREAVREQLAVAQAELRRLERQGMSDWRAEADVSTTAIQASATVGTADASGLGLVPQALGRLGFGESLRWGLYGAYARWSAASDTASANWGVGEGGLWLGWQGDGWHVAVLGGVGLGAGSFNDGQRSVSLTTLGAAGSLLAEVHIADRWSLALRGGLCTGDLPQIAVQPALRFWWRPAFALQLTGTYLQNSGSADQGMDVSASAFGAGLGLLLRR